MNQLPDPPSSSEHPPEQKKTGQIFRGFRMTVAVVLGLIGLAALTPQSNPEALGLFLFALLFPTTLLALGITLYPRTARFGLGMLLGCGTLLLFSFALCTVRR